MPPRSRRLAAGLVLTVAVLVLTALPAPAAAVADPTIAAAPPELRWSWPVEPHEVIRAYAAPATEYAAGHRGIDLPAPAGTVVAAPADGVVHFAGVVGDRTVLSIDHGGGVLSSFEPVRPLLAAGSAVHRGEPVAVVDESAGHCEVSCLHLGARRDGRYLSPLVLLEGIPRAVLLPLRPGDQARG